MNHPLEFFELFGTGVFYMIAYQTNLYARAGAMDTATMAKAVPFLPQAYLTLTLAFSQAKMS